MSYYHFNPASPVNINSLCIYGLNQEYRPTCDYTKLFFREDQKSNRPV